MAITWVPFDQLITIKIEPIYAGKVKGLCGTFNWNKKDDLMTRDGDIETSIESFIERYAIDAEFCENNPIAVNVAEDNACLVFPDRADLAENQCYELIASVDLKCKAEIDLEAIRGNCIRHSCTDDDGDICKIYNLLRNLCRK